MGTNVDPVCGDDKSYLEKIAGGGVNDVDAELIAADCQSLAIGGKRQAAFAEWAVGPRPHQFAGNGVPHPQQRENFDGPRRAAHATPQMA